MEWRSIHGFSAYEISECGDVRRVVAGVGRASCRGQIGPRKTSGNGDGYLTTAIVGDDGRRRTMRVHRLVCTAWHGPAPTPKHEGAHNDGSRANNHFSNLEWKTTKANQADRKLHGSDNAGERHGNVRLTWNKVSEIRRRRRLGEAGLALAKEFGVTPQHIGCIASGKTWKTDRTRLQHWPWVEDRSTT
jgi:HNH endonuclease